MSVKQSLEKGITIKDMYNQFDFDKDKPISIILYSNIKGKEFTLTLKMDEYNGISVYNIFNISKNDDMNNIVYIIDFKYKFSDKITKIEILNLNGNNDLNFIITRYNKKYVILGNIESISNGDNTICLNVLDINIYNTNTSYEKWINNDKFIITTIIHGIEYEMVINDRNIFIKDSDNAPFIIKYLYTALNTIIKPEINKDYIINRVKCNDSQYDLNITFNVFCNVKLSITGKIVNDFDINKDGYSTIKIDMESINKYV